jgi:glycosyltransferase involved in cell wall biosynthesis
VNEGCYFREVISPLLQGPGVEFIGEIDERTKTEFLGHAAALVFPIDWPEPFGLVMIEAMACGTPVLAFPCGSVPEIIEDGVTGRIASTMDEAVRAVPQVLALDRKDIRRRFEERFSSTRMTKDYLRLYRSMLRKAPGKAPRRGVDVPVLAAGPAAAVAQLSTGSSPDLIPDTVSLGHELCTDQV